MGGCRKKACSNKCSCREKRIGCYRGPEIPCLNVEEGDIYDDIIGKIGEVICEGGFEEIIVEAGDNVTVDIEQLGDITIYTINSTGGGGEILIEITRADLTGAIANNELVPGATYKITGVHKERTVNVGPVPAVQVPALYDDGRGLGTTIFLKAVSENKLENSGSGIFYNPNYDLNTPGYGIWTNKVSVTLSNISGTFNLSNRETITANNGATGKILTKGWIEYISGDWANATSLSGDDSGTTADIDSVSVPSYNVDDVVFWGGYAWKNKNGNVGSQVDVLNLDAEWEKLNYTDSNYNEVVDYIEYDIENDFITRRRNEEYNIDVNVTFDIYLMFNLQSNFQYSSISVMNYGLGVGIGMYDPNGINGVKVNNSYAELVNFKGSFFSNVNFDNGSYFQNVNFDNGGFSNVNFDNGSYVQNTNFNNGSNFYGVNFNNGSNLQNVNFDNNSYLQDVNFDNGGSFNGVNFNNNSYFFDVNFDNGSSFQNVNFNNNSNFYGVNFNNNSYFQNVNFVNNSYFYGVDFDSFAISYGLATILLDGKTIRYTDFKGIGDNLSLPDLSSANIIFNSGIRKEVIYIQGATNDCKLITYDTSGNRVVNDIDD